MAELIPTDETGQGSDDREWWLGNRARVFISCGQRGPEVETAASLRDLIRSMGFCPYVAIEVHSLRGLTEGIYERLQTADYFLFVDFPRDSLAEPGTRRGSLFSNQELAIASFLEIDVLPFLHTSVLREGILDHIQGNPILFDSPEDLIQKVEHHVRESAWDSRSRREVKIERTPGQFENAYVPAPDTQGHSSVAIVRYYHLWLHNLHWRTPATDCIVHVLSVRKLVTSEEYHPDAVELKFKHVTSPSVTIPPRTRRQFDCIIVPVDNPSTAIVGILNPTHLDSQRAVLQHTIKGPGDFELNLIAYSREFRPTSCEVRLHLGTSIDDVKLTLAEGKPRQ